MVATLAGGWRFGGRVGAVLVVSTLAAWAVLWLRH